MAPITNFSACPKITVLVQHTATLPLCTINPFHLFLFGLQAITVLAPDNEAWRQLLATQPAATPAWLQQAVLTHVISQQLGTRQLPSGGVIVRSLAQGGKPINIGRTAGGDIQVQVFGSAGGWGGLCVEPHSGGHGVLKAQVFKSLCAHMFLPISLRPCGPLP